MSTVSNYKNRTVDVAAFKGWGLGKDTKVEQQLVLPGKSGEVFAGIEKLVQRFAIELLTELASMPYLPARGSTFMLDARSGVWQTTGDVATSFSQSVLTIADNLSAEETASDPADERFSSATLLSVSLLGDSVTLSVEVTSDAGTSFTALLPLTVVPY